MAAHRLATALPLRALAARLLAVLGWCALALLLVRCDSSNPPENPPPTLGGVRHLDLGNASGTDDDPSLIRALDGAYYLVFLSDRSGSKQLWATRSTDGLLWSTPRQITNNGDENLFPTLLQTDDGVFHLCWNRFSIASGGTQHIYYARSFDGLNWNAAAQVQLTSGLVGDRVTGMIAVGSSELRLYFSSAQRSQLGKPFFNDDLLVMRSLDRGLNWQPPTLLAGASSDTEQDRFVSVIQLAPNNFQMVLNRQASADLIDPTSDVFLASSSDGLAWGAPFQITANAADNVFDLWPNFIFAPVANQWYLSWTSTAFTNGGVVVLPLGGQYPVQAVDLDTARGVVGWSTRAAGALMIWVNSTTGTPQLWAGLNLL
jgi:hypothetical protein